MAVDARHHLLRPRRPLAGHRRRRRPARPPRSAPSSTIPAGRPPTAPRSATCRCASGSPSSTASTPSRCSSPTARCRPTPSCSTSSSRAGDAVIVEKPTYDRTLLNLRNRGADVRMVVAARPTASTSTRCATLLDGGVAPDARAHHPQLPEPGRLHAVAGQAPARCSRSPREYGFTDLRGRPVRRRSASAGEPLPTMLSTGRRGPRRLRVVVLQDRLPGHPRRLPRRAGRADRRDRQAARPTPTSRPTWWPQSIVYQFCVDGGDRPLDRDASRRRSPSASRR